MKILGIDPSLSCTGLCLIIDGHDEKYNHEIETGFIKVPPCELNTRINEIINRIENFLIDSWIGDGVGYEHLTAVFIEGEAMKGSGQVVQLAELCGAIKHHFTSHGIKVLTFTPSQARKLELGKGTIPFKKDKQKKEYIDFIRDKIRTEAEPYDFGYEVADIYDAIVIAKAGAREWYDIGMTAALNPELVEMRLHDEKILTKNNKKVYSFGTGKKKVKFKKLSEVDNETWTYLVQRYSEILGRDTKT